MPTTRSPDATASRAVSWPTSPSPMTAMHPPGPTSACRNPCSAMAPKVVNAAESSSTSSGMGAHSRPATIWNSPWAAPAVATRIPGRMPATAAPTSTTTPQPA